jgi:hypothetical protein
MRPAIAAHGGDPEELGGLEDVEDIRPWRRRRARITETEVLLGYGLHAVCEVRGHSDSSVSLSPSMAARW